MASGFSLNVPQPRRHRRWLIALALVAALAGGAGVGFQRACARPTDISGTVQVPGWLSRVKEQDAVAYPVHVTLGTVLAKAGCDPTAVGLQWLKAAAHARGPVEVSTTAAGLRQAAGQLGSPSEVESTLCPFLGRVFASPTQRTALADANLQCPGIAPASAASHRSSTTAR